MGGVDGGMVQLTDTVVPELDQTLSEMRELSASFKRLSEEVESNPNILLLGKQPAAPGPGE
jgi:phospholipid/cholesterol/gamma-HCH transport system substrate-binding protein